MVAYGSGGVVKGSFQVGIRDWRLQAKRVGARGAVWAGRKPRAPGRPLRFARGKLGLKGRVWPVTVAVLEGFDGLVLVEVLGRKSGGESASDGLNGQLERSGQVGDYLLGGSHEVGAGLIHALLAGQTALGAGAAAEGDNGQQGQEVERTGKEGDPSAGGHNPITPGNEMQGSKYGFHTEVEESGFREVPPPEGIGIYTSWGNFVP
jgi:hypothetical protein